MPAALLEAAAEVAPLIAAEADAADAAGRITPPVLDALIGKRLFRLWIPAELDGEEADLPTSLEIFERLSRADGSAGWAVMIGAGAGLFAGFLEREAAAEIYLPPEAVVAGSGAPTGSARREGEAYRVSGRWAYASGAHHATWFTASCVVEDADGAAVEAPVIRAVAVPAAGVVIDETWSVAGMRATGSHDIEIRDRLVPDAYTFSVFDDVPRVPGPLYRFPFNSIAELSFAAVSLGIARQALDEFRRLAGSKRAPGAATPLLEVPDVQFHYGRAEATVGSARAAIHDRAARAWETVVRGDTLADRERARIRLAAVDCVQRCAEATSLVYARAGMTPLFSDSRLGRAWRDAHAVTQHVMVAADGYAEAVRMLLGGDAGRG